MNFGKNGARHRPRDITYMTSSRNDPCDRTSHKNRRLAVTGSSQSHGLKLSN